MEKYELWPSVFLKKLSMVKIFVIVQMVNFRGGYLPFDHCLRPISNIKTMSTKCLFAMPLTYSFRNPNFYRIKKLLSSIYLQAKI